MKKLFDVYHIQSNHITWNHEISASLMSYADIKGKEQNFVEDTKLFWKIAVQPKSNFIHLKVLHWGCRGAALPICHSLLETKGNEGLKDQEECGTGIGNGV